MNWHDVLPSDVATEHWYWERRYAMVAMRKHGYTLQAIGDKFGRTRERVRSILAKAYREQQFAEARGFAYPMKSPLERYLASTAIPGALLQAQKRDRSAPVNVTR